MVPLIVSSALAQPDVDVLASAWSDARRGPITPGDLQILAAGDPIAHRVDTPDGAMASAAIWVDAPIAQTWVAIQDAKDRPLGRAATSFLPGESVGRRTVYVKLDLPWPVADRQWVAEFVNDAAAYVQSGGRRWVRHWQLADPALADEADDRAVWVAENRGSWTLVPAGEGTLAILQVRSAFGGAVPAEVSQSWASGSLKRMLRTLAEIAPEMATHYDADHPVMYAPDGAPIPPFTE